jgi:hypothetical protein
MPREDEWTAGDVRRTLMDPRYAGALGYPAIVKPEQWVQANMKLLEQMGPEAYLTRLLALMTHEMDEG